MLAAALLAGSAVVAAASQPPAGQTGDAPRPTAAVIALDGLPLAALFETRLIENRRAAWLERVKIDALLSEQKLTALLAPESGRQRAEVGQLLKADVLVLFEQTPKPEPHVRLVVCETRQGLRLVVHDQVLSADAEADAEQLATVVDQALVRFGQEVREIVAVPPFVCNDLTFEREYLKAAYGKLAEQAVRGQPGLLTVELEEARAIGRELAIAGERQLEARALPLYLLGEYRHEGKGEKLTATVRMRMMRGEQELATREAGGLASADAARFVQQAANELIEKSAGVRPMPPDAKLEARQLASRAEVFFQLGNWEEATALAEASLLLDGSDLRMREVAIYSLGSAASRYTENQKDAELLVRGIRLYLRGVEHLEIWRQGDFPLRDDRSELPLGAQRLNGGMKVWDRDDLRFLHFTLTMHLEQAAGWGQLLHVKMREEGAPDEAADLCERELEILLRMVRTKTPSGTDEPWRYLNWAIRERPLAEQYDIMLEAVRSIQDWPNASQYTYALSGHGYSIGILDCPEGREYLDRLDEFPSEQVRKAAADIRRDVQRYIESEAAKEPKRSPTLPKDIGPQRLRFEPVQIEFLLGEDSKGEPPRYFSLMAAGEGADLLWDTSNRLFLMREPGRAELIWNCGYIDHIGTRIEDAKYDGRFAWVTTSHPATGPRLLVIDPRQGQVWEVTEDDGLPVVAQESIRDPQQVHPKILVAPLEPGKVLLVSWFGRMAIGTATFDPDKGAQVEMFFEARHQVDQTSTEPWRDLQMAFPPGYAIGFRGTDAQGRPLRKVLVGTQDQDGQYQRNRYPLVVDPDRKQVDVLPHEIGGELEPNRLAFASDAIYGIQMYSRRLHLDRIGLPDFKSETLMEDVLEGYCIKHGEMFIVLGSRCWLLDPNATSSDERVRVIADRPPWGYLSGTYLGSKFAGEAAEPPEELLPYQFKLICRSGLLGTLVQRTSVERDCETFRILIDGEPPAP